MPSTDKSAYRALADLYHGYLTGLILALLVKRDEHEVEELIFRLFRKKHLEQFLPGLEKLGLRENGGSQLPDAVVCAQYHYLSNFLGGVSVEYIPESERKAWIRYPPPRWIWQGVAIAAIPSAVSAAMMRGWHAHNGVTLGNPRLGFVCTKQTVDGRPGLEGYYYEYDHELEESERLRFAPNEEAPPFDPTQAPRAPSNAWPEERLAKAYRNYAMDYVATILPLVLDLVGETEGLAITRHTARTIGLQFHEPLVATLGIDRSADFASLLHRLTEAHGDSMTVEQRGGVTLLEQQGWRFARAADPGDHRQASFESWAELFVGLALSHDRFAQLTAEPIDLAGTIRWHYSKAR